MAIATLLSLAWPWATAKVVSVCCLSFKDPWVLESRSLLKYYLIHVFPVGAGFEVTGNNNVLAGCVISGNNQGLYIVGNSNIVHGNIVGLDVAGAVAFGNVQNGIQCDIGSDNTTITNNTVSGNSGSGIVLLGSRNSVVQGNMIGLDVGNALDGVQCSTGTDNTTIIDNTISGNRRNGIGVLGSSRIRIEANRFEGNALDAVQSSTNKVFVSVINNTFSARFRPGSAAISISSEGTRALGNTFTSINSTTESLVRSSVSGMPVLRIFDVRRSGLEGTWRKRMKK